MAQGGSIMKKIIAFLKEVQAIIYHLEKEAASGKL